MTNENEVQEKKLPNGMVLKRPTSVIAKPKLDSHFIDDPYSDLSREDILNKLNIPEGVQRGQVYRDAVNQSVVGEAPHQDDLDIRGLSELSPEFIRETLTEMIRSSFKNILQADDFTEGEIDEIIADLGTKLEKLSMKEIKALNTIDLKNIYGPDVFNTIKSASPNKYAEAAKNLLLNMKEGFDDMDQILDTWEESHKHLEFFNSGAVDSLTAIVREKVEAKEYEHYFIKYLDYLKTYIEELETVLDDEPDHKFYNAELEFVSERYDALVDALTCKTLFEKTRNSAGRLLKDLTKEKVVTRTISDFLNRIHNDATMKVTFPVPANFNVTVNRGEALASIWISFIEMVILRVNKPTLRQLTPQEHNVVTSRLLGIPLKDIPYAQTAEYQLKDFDVDMFIDGNQLTKDNVIVSRQTSYAITYIIARAFKPKVIENRYYKYVLGFVMNILTQSLNEEYAEHVIRLISGVNEILIEEQTK